MTIHSVIVGGTRGIGRELAGIFACAGHMVSVLGRSELPAEVAGDPRVAGWQVDVTDSDQVSRALSEVLNRSAIVHNLVFLQRYRGDGDRWRGEVETSLTATMTIIEALKGHFTSPEGGAIVLVSSIADEFVSTTQPLSYHVAKSGIVQMTRYYAAKLGPVGIRVNCVSPSAIVKPESKEFYDKNGELKALYAKAVPLGRMGTALEVARVIAFLCGKEASFVTGQRLVVDGGASIVSQEALARALVGV